MMDGDDAQRKWRGGEGGVDSCAVCKCIRCGGQGPVFTVRLMDTLNTKDVDEGVRGIAL